MSEKALIGVPTYNGWVSADTAMACSQHGCERVAWHYSKISLLAYNFNKLLTKALNDKFDYFCLLHADVAPKERGWLKRMIGMMEEKQYKVLSLVLPITSNGLDTSTALDAIGEPRRLKMAELPQLPVVFDGRDTKRVFNNSKLLVNTGCMLIDLRDFRPKKSWFEINDSIVQLKDGTYDAKCDPEDWNFSRMLIKNRVPYGATYAIPAIHAGQVQFTNQVVKNG